MTESMIERVRDAIFKEMDVADGLDLPAAQRYARAAIEAMREPTDLMIEAAESTFSHFEGDHGEYNTYFSESQAMALWPTMIDAALNPLPA